MKKSAIIKSCSGLLVLPLMFAFLSGCAPKKSGGLSDTTALASQAATGEKLNFSWDVDDNVTMPAAPADVLKKALTALGTPYVRGGNAPNEGFDCSGFVQWAYQSSGIRLPRTAREQSVVGLPIKRSEDMKTGDIVAFWHPRRGYHTGIYVGDEKFIHSPRKRQVVRINSLNDPYFNGTFLGARRINRTDDAEYERLEMNLQAYSATQGKMREIAANMPAEVKKDKKDKKNQKGSKANMVASATKGKESSSGKNSVAAKDSKAGKVASSKVAEQQSPKGKVVASLDKKSNSKSANDSLVSKQTAKKPSKDEAKKSSKDDSKKSAKSGKEPQGKKAADKSGKNRNT